MAEAGHTYELIKAILTDQRNELTEEEIFFGPLIVREKNSVFYQKWQGQLTYNRKLLQNLNKAKKKDKNRISEVKNYIELIEQEINND